jgi:hypothetical protein
MKKTPWLMTLALALAACRGEGAARTEPWKVGVFYSSPSVVNARGLLDRRGLIHAHSVYSHDACDNQPVKNGARDPVCFDDFRDGLCRTMHDFVFLTDHDDGFGQTEFPEVLLYRPDRGDALVERDGASVASRLACPDGRRVLTLAGTESETMAVGLESHVAPAGERSAIYNDVSATAVQAMKAKGAVSLLQHTERWTAEQIGSLPVDGFEMFNLHALTLREAVRASELLNRVILKDEGLPAPDLALLGFLSEDPRYLSTWGTVLARGARRVTTLGTDCHRNTFQPLMADGERVDSYRRMMSWFSNHLLVRPQADGTFDDRDLKDALREGRLYGAFEFVGTPAGFDAHAETAGGVAELGSEVRLADAPALVATMPTLKNLDPAREKPMLTLRLLRAKEGGWDEVAASDRDVRYTPTTPGAYRFEVRMVPRHLRADLNDDAEALLARDLVWIYANPFYVR